MEIELFSGGEYGLQAAAASNSRRGKKYHRHGAHQIQRLEEYFKEFRHPDENQRRELAMELGLTAKQVQFWFQYKRTQTKAQNDRDDNSILRCENERIQSENQAIREALKNLNCFACGGPSCGHEERKRSLKKLQQQNAQLKQEHERVTGFLSKCFGKPISEVEKYLATLPQGSSILGLPVRQLDSFLSQPMAMDIQKNDQAVLLPNKCQVNGLIDMNRAPIVDTARGAMEELIKLLELDEPLWDASPSDGRCFLLRENYEKIFPGRASSIRSFTNSSQFECSRHSGIVTMSAMHLVDMFLDSNKWADIFPTIVTKEKTIRAIENGVLENRHGSLQMIYEKLHILSPLVPSREFCFLRYCRQIERGTWVIMDVSYDFSKEGVSPSGCWRLPSGCMIQEMSNGCSKVTWVEHVRVDDKNQTHRLYRDLVYGNYAVAYGAERWVLTLKRMCERFTFFSKLPETAPANDGFGGVMAMAEGKQNIMNLCHRMVKNFCGTLNMSDRLDFTQPGEMTNSGVRVSVRESTETGQPSGVIVCTTTSLWLPLPPQAVFDFLTDDKTRFQWDILSNGYPVKKIEHISTGAHPGNCVSIKRTFAPTESHMLVLQESCIDPLGALVVYAPVDVTTLSMAITGKDSSDIPILPSGFIISADGRGTIDHRSLDAFSATTSSCATISSSSSAGSLLTVAFQILISCKQFNMESVAAVNTLISSAVHKIKSSLNCSNDLD